MQVQHKVGVAAEFLHLHAQGAQLVQGLQGFEAVLRRFADGAHVGLGVCAQLLAYTFGHGIAQVDPVAVEVFVAQQVVAACVRVADQLCLANRVDGGHQNDFTLDQSFFVGLGQQRHQVVHGHGAGHFVGVDGRLHVDLGACTGFAKTQHWNAALGAGRHAGQGDGTCLEGHAVSWRIVLIESKA